MAQAKRDNNRAVTLIGVSSGDGVTPVNIAVSPITGKILASLIDNSQAGVSVSIKAETDDNFVKTALCQNSTNENNVSPFAVNPDNGAILINYN